MIAHPSGLPVVDRALARLPRHWAPAVALVAIAFGVAFTAFILTRQDWVMSDGLVYREAADRLRAGEPLYPPADIDERSYRYAPWFAAAWMIVQPPDAVWIGAMTVCAGLAVVPALRAGWLGVAAAAVIFPYMLTAAMGGHVQPALLAALAFTIHSRWAPIAIAVTASLKLVPILYVAVYLARRQWVHAGVTILLTAMLVAPFLLFDLRHFPTSTEGSWGLFEWSPILWVIVVVALLAYVARHPSWPAASVLVTIAIPKFVYYDVGYLLVGLSPSGKRNASE